MTRDFNRDSAQVDVLFNSRGTTGLFTFVPKTRKQYTRRDLYRTWPALFSKLARGQALDYWWIKKAVVQRK